jgi:hypothetical protein
LTTQGARERAGDLFQALIARQMPERVLVWPEVVDIDQEDAQRLAVGRS